MSTSSLRAFARLCAYTWQNERLRVELYRGDDGEGRFSPAATRVMAMAASGGISSYSDGPLLVQEGNTVML
jgi:hypothetical protein